MLELRSCEVPAGFFTQDPGKAGIETLIVESVPSFSNAPAQSVQLEGAAASGAAGTDPRERRWAGVLRADARPPHAAGAGDLEPDADGGARAGELRVEAQPPHAAGAGDLEPDADGGARAGPGLDRAGETGSGQERGQPRSAVCQLSAGSALAASAQVQTEPEDGAQMLQVWR